MPRNLAELLKNKMFFETNLNEIIENTMQMKKETTAVLIDSLSLTVNRITKRLLATKNNVNKRARTLMPINLIIPAY
jgi:hypothetical protein